MKRRKRAPDYAAYLRLAVAALALITLGFLFGLLTPRPIAQAVEHTPTILSATHPGNEALPISTETVALPKFDARYALTDSERDVVERVVMAEAGGEDFDGQVLVAQCVLNTSEARGMRPDAVVLEAGQYTTPATKASDQVKAAVSAVFDDGYIVTDEPVRFFYAPKYCNSPWHENKLEFVLEHGGHRFFKEAVG